MKQRVGGKELSVGQPVPWNVYDDSGILLLRRGEIVQSERTLERFIEAGLYVKEEEYLSRPVVAPVAEEPSALQPVADARRLMALLYDKVPDQIEGLPHRIATAADAVQAACDVDATIALAAILLLQEGEYSARHPVDVAVLSCVLAREMKLPPEQVRAVVCAALTMNIGMYEVQEKVNAIGGQLNDKLMGLIRRHPKLGAERLRQLGIDDPVWLRIVAQHHEHSDGSGYPDGLAGEAIDLGARILVLADKYCAMVCARKYRNAARPNVALRDLYIKQGQKIDVTVAGTMIRVVGIYPPGTLVRLKSQEIGVVTGPGNGPDTPAVHAVIGRSGTALEVASYRKTHLEATAIEDVLTVDKLAVPLRLSSIWGKKARLR